MDGSVVPNGDTAPTSAEQMPIFGHSSTGNLNYLYEMYNEKRYDEFVRLAKPLFMTALEPHDRIRLAALLGFVVGPYYEAVEWYKLAKNGWRLSELRDKSKDPSLVATQAELRRYIDDLELALKEEFEELEAEKSSIDGFDTQVQKETGMIDGVQVANGNHAVDDGDEGDDKDGGQQKDGRIELPIHLKTRPR